MASSTTSGNLTVYEHEEGDAGTMPKVSAMSPQVIGAAWDQIATLSDMP